MMERILEDFSRRTYGLSESVSRGSRYKKFPTELDKDLIVGFLESKGFTRHEYLRASQLIRAAAEENKNLYCTDDYRNGCIMFSNGEYCHRIDMDEESVFPGIRFSIINKSGKVILKENNWKKFRENCILDFYDWK